MSDHPPPPNPPAGSTFCAECNAAMPADARFCGACGAKPPGAAGAAGADPTQVSGGASTWQGVAPVVERTEAIPPVPPGAGAPASVGPPPGGPPAGAGAPPPPAGGKSKGPLIAAIVVVLALLAGGAFLLLGGDDDGDDESADIEREDREDEDEETTTTTEAEETTTTTEGDETTTTTAVVDDETLTFLQATDDSGLLVVEVPDFWQPNGSPLADGTPNIIAAEDFAAFAALDGSGVSFTRLTGNNLDPDATIDFLANTNNLFNACTAEERTDYADPVFTGRRQVFANCEGAGITVVEIAANRISDGASIEVTIVLDADDPFEIVERIEATFNLTA